LRTNTFAYDSKKRLAATTYGAVGQTYRPIYEKNASGHEYPDDVVVGIKLDGKFTDQTIKDGLGRVATRTLTVENSSLLTENYNYLKTSLASGKTIETAIIAGTTGQIGSTSANTSYTYDISGNIETVTVDSVLVAKYHYDKWNRLKREDNHKFGKTYTWEYDIGGNITKKRTYALCTGDDVSGEYTSDSYEYVTSGWKDQLTSFNGEVCEYDALGNPTTYRGKTLNWTKVRRLSKFGDVEFTYNANGLRTSKKANGITRSSIFAGNKLLKETFSNGSELVYYYGEDGVIGFNYGGVDYYYRKNVQGDILGIFTSSGAIIAKYVYDAWGNHKIYDANNIEVFSASHIGLINPFRYRGYYFDTETGLYYVKERYYDPQIGRWLNIDKAISASGRNVHGYNLYAYCFNNPVNFNDEEGEWPKWVEKAAKIASVVVAVAAVVTTVVAVSAFTAGTGTPTAVYGATVFLGAALSGINGGVANEAKGNSYANGYLGGATGGVIQGLCSKTPVGTIVGGGVGVTLGTAVTDLMNNLDPDSVDSTATEIASNAITSGGKALVTSSLTAYMGYASTSAVSNGANGLMPQYTFGFGESVKAFFGWLDDALVYLWE
jgi:RHS repeat-associated protein